MLYPFFVVSLYSIMEVLKNKKNKIQTKTGDWIDTGDLLTKRTMRTISVLLDWGLPILVTHFIIIYWALGLIKYTWSDVHSIC